MQSGRLWAVEVKHFTHNVFLGENVSLWILAQTLVLAIRKAEKFARQKGYARFKIVRTEDKGTIDVF